jgi:hypothetical protein
LKKNVEGRKSGTQFYTVFVRTFVITFYYGSGSATPLGTASNPQFWICEDQGSYLRILAEVDNAAEEVEETLEALEWLEQVDEGVCRQLLVVLRGNLNAHLKVGRHRGKFTSFVKDKKSLRCHKTAEINISFIFFLLDDERNRIRRNKLRIRIKEAQKHRDP